VDAPELRAAAPLTLQGIELRNRLVGTAHGSGISDAGLPLPADADYWRRRAAGGAAMLIVGGTVTAPESTWRARPTTESWRPEAVPGMTLRAQAIREEGAVACAQLVHLGRETLGAETWYHPVAPSAVRSPREPTRPRALSDHELDAIVEGFRLSAVHAATAGFQVVELHAAHGYLLAQFLSPVTNQRPEAASVEGRVAIVARIVAAIRDAVPEVAVGIRLSAEGGEEAGFGVDGLCELLPHASALVDYVNLTAGVRTTYVKDMATTRPPLLSDVERIRPLVDRPLLVSQAFRRAAEIEAALAAGADLVGVARPLIADPDFPRKLLEGREADVRPCVSCNEDCRAFDPVLLCAVNPELAPPGETRRPANPLVIRSSADGNGRVAIVGAGPAGLECATVLGRSREVVLFDEREAIGGQLAVAASAPNRSGWGRLIDFYAAGLDATDNVTLQLGQRVGARALDGFDEVVLAVGSTETLPELPGAERALTASQAIALGADAFRGRSRLLIVDDGFGWWPCASAVELAIAAGVEQISVATPGAAFGGTLPPEGRVQLLRRLAGAPLTVRPFTALVALADGAAELRNTMSGATEELSADVVVIVGERRARDWSALVPPGAGVRVIGDALVPRKVAHAISEGRAVAEALARIEAPALSA
jgi:2,4-dienoyl-CoA reductase-like NADH-dependent reductase (Old Yellow Enzyme family)